MSTQTSTPVTVGSRIGLHARPAALIAKCVGGLDATVRIGRDESSLVDAASPLMIVSLGAKLGDTVVIAADGPEAEQALVQVRELVERDLDADD